ncbi:dUTP diphosphatase [Candidatus Saccharibacteria bacterium]|nr:dUTP diphosphatase [Candidatus Saccharibacteria bacterium]
MKVKVIKLRKSVAVPEYQTEYSAGMDLHAAIDEPIILQPMERKVIPAGIAIALPDGHEAQVRARSGLALKHGITTANGIGTIDADYRGEVGAIMVNLGTEPFVIEPNMRIAQLVLARYEKIEWQEVRALDETERSAGGFGSTGK